MACVDGCIGGAACSHGAADRKAIEDYGGRSQLRGISEAVGRKTESGEKE